MMSNRTLSQLVNKFKDDFENNAGHKLAGGNHVFCS